MKLILSLLLAFQACTPLAFAAPPIIYEFSAPLTKTGTSGNARQISIPRASSSVSGYIHKDDFLTFQGNSLPSQTGNSGKYLTTNGSVPSWSTVSTLPSQTGNSGKYLTTNGTSASWGTITAPAWGAISGTLSSQTDLQSALDAKQNSLSLGNLTDAGTDGITVTGGTGAIIGSGVSLSQHVADSTHNGYLSSTDWSTFNNKQSTISTGNLTEATSSVLTISGGTGSVVGSGTSIQVKAASTSQSGYLSSTDWNTFNGKQSALSLPLSISNGGTGLSSTSQNYIFAGPTSGSGAPSWRAMVAADVPTLNQNTSGTANLLSSNWHFLAYDSKSLGTPGGACNWTNNTFNNRDLNTIQSAGDTGITLSSNKITGVVAGTWHIWVRCPAEVTVSNRYVCDLYDNTNSASKASSGCVGQGANSTTGGGDAIIDCVLTLSGTTDFYVRTNVQTESATTSCLGASAGASGIMTAFDHETFTQVHFTRLK